MRVAVLGAAGYSGLELLKLLATHPSATIACAASDAHAGRPIGELTGRRSDLRFVATDAAIAIARDCDAALLAVPPEAAPKLIEALGDRPKVVDLSNAHRATPGIPYGLVSLFPEVAGHRIVANPGCYATCVITAAAPLLDRIEGDVIACASSGVTGAGRQASEAASLAEAYGDVRAYKVLRHQHVPEIEAAFRALGNPWRVTLTTHLLPIARGIFATLTLKLRRPATTSELIELYRQRYGSDPTVTLGGVEDVAIKKVVGTNQCMIGVACDGDRAIVTAALDNLIKGAAGQAIENLNLMLGAPRLAGLEHLARHA